MKDYLNTFKTHIFLFLYILIHYVFYILIFFNIALININYIDYLDALLQIFISGFLLIRFGFSYSNSISDFDKRLIITCSSILLLNTLFTKVFKTYFTSIESYLKQYFKNI